MNLDQGSVVVTCIPMMCGETKIVLGSVALAPQKLNLIHVYVAKNKKKSTYTVVTRADIRISHTRHVFSATVEINDVI